MGNRSARGVSDVHAELQACQNVIPNRRAAGSIIFPKLHCDQRLNARPATKAYARAAISMLRRIDEREFHPGEFQILALHFMVLASRIDWRRTALLRNL